jgi:hypothetical protein
VVLGCFANFATTATGGRTSPTSWVKTLHCVVCAER